MNKQELQKRVNGLSSTLLDKRVLVNKSAIIGLIEQLDEPQKVVIPRFVAEWIEYIRETDDLGFLDLFDFPCWSYNDLKYQVSVWFRKGNEENLARAWLDGYEVEQERLYTVEIPNPNNTSPKYKLMLVKGINGIEILRDYYNKKRDQYIFQLTEAEIKQDFEWAWQWAEEVADDTEV